MTNTNSKLLPLNTYKKHNISYQSRTEATKTAGTIQSSFFSNNSQI